VSLGHRRLSILDLSPAGHQPMWTPCRKYAIIFNGEVYNHLELRDQTHSVEYRGHSDTQMILHYLAQRGILLAGHFNGIFAFGLVDAEKQKLYLARDPFGVKPLYYWAGNESFLFSFELRTPREFSEDSYLACPLR
jgi:asparagine synthase (glutamine-hydrolysing)